MGIDLDRTKASSQNHVKLKSKKPRSGCPSRLTQNCRLKHGHFLQSRFLIQDVATTNQRPNDINLLAEGAANHPVAGMLFFGVAELGSTIVGVRGWRQSNFAVERPNLPKHMRDALAPSATRNALSDQLGTIAGVRG